MGLSNFIKKKPKIYLSQMTIIYKIKPNDTRIRLFGKKFIENNKDKCKMIINGKEKNLEEYYTLDNNFKGNELEIKLKGMNKIENASYMFELCKYLGALPDISKWDTSNITNIDCIFSQCLSLSYISDISFWNTSKVTTMMGVFNNCISLIELPDISK